MSLDELNRKLKEQNLIGYWTIPNTSTGFREPEANFSPFLWKWNEIRPALDDAAKFIRPEEAFRRFIGYQHPELRLGTAHTLLLGAQMVRPGEFAPAHRHTMGAIRFVVEGHGAATVVEGEPLPMEPGDLITTPSWTWHDHVNSSETPIIWLDGAMDPCCIIIEAGFLAPFLNGNSPSTNRSVGRRRPSMSCDRKLDRLPLQQIFARRTATPGRTPRRLSREWPKLRAIPSTESCCAIPIRSAAEPPCRR
jgi:gentisate 1,2-dioxygenase